MKKKKITKIKTKRIVLASLYFLLFYLGLTTFLRSYGEFVSTVQPVSTGKVDNVMYINDLTSDYNYFKGLNYTKIFNANTIPSETNTGYYIFSICSDSNKECLIIKQLWKSRETLQVW